MRSLMDDACGIHGFEGNAIRIYFKQPFLSCSLLQLLPVVLDAQLACGIADLFDDFILQKENTPLCQECVLKMYIL